MQSRLVPEKCIACGLCQVYAPNIFDYDDHGIVLFKDEPHARQQFIPENERENVLKAYRKCPTRAFLLRVFFRAKQVFVHLSKQTVIVLLLAVL